MARCIVKYKKKLFEVKPENIVIIKDYIRLFMYFKLL